MDIIKSIPKIQHVDSGNFFLLAGPCVIEAEEITMLIASKLKELSDKYHIPLIFKGSYRKANRSRIDSFTGIGDLKALKMLSETGKKMDIPVITDVHSVNDVQMAAKYVDVLQIPAFLCRQTDLLVAAARSGKWVNIKKGQFLSPESMKYAVNKVIESGNDKVMITDRGTMFGYHDLIVDFRGIVEMKKFGRPVVLDITHSLQQPNQPEGISGGKPEMIETIAKAGVAVGVDGIFLETHPEPQKAKSDGANMLKMELLENMLVRLITIRTAINKS